MGDCGEFPWSFMHSCSVSILVLETLCFASSNFNLPPSKCRAIWMTQAPDSSLWPALTSYGFVWTTVLHPSTMPRRLGNHCMGHGNESDQFFRPFGTAQMHSSTMARRGIWPLHGSTRLLCSNASMNIMMVDQWARMIGGSSSHLCLTPISLGTSPGPN